MNEIKYFTQGSKNPFNLVATLKYKYQFLRDNPDFFNPSGIWVFCGAQGSGKTLSAIDCLFKMMKKYPKALVVSNLDIKGVEYIKFTDYQQLIDLDNGTDGIIFFIDEIHILWNSLESKDIPISEMACFCQMRKNRRVIIGTSQVYSRITKPIREQLKYCIDCNNILNIIQVNNIMDVSNVIEDSSGHIHGDVVKRQIWFHYPELYKSYDTLFKIERIERKKKGVIYYG